MMNILSRTPPTADHRIHYDAGEFQFGDLWLPSARDYRGKLPVVVFFHGGWWQSMYDLAYAGELCAALRGDGFAVWSVEYRRIGQTGGGWPTTFEDAAAGFDHIAELAKIYPFDLSRVVAMGHSAGGHLTFWLAGRHHVPAGSPLSKPQPRVLLRGVISLAGVVDLRMTRDLSGHLSFAHDKREVDHLMGGPPEQFPERYRAGNPGDLMPLGVPQTLLQGTLDDQIPPELPARWAEQSRRQGDGVTVRIIPGADHFDVVDPRSKAWPVVRDAVRMMLP